MAKKYLIGSVSSGTTLFEDIFPDFINVARELECDEATLLEIEKRMEADNYYESENTHQDSETLFDLLNGAAPPYFYFGVREGNGAGFWLCEDAIADFDGLQVSDTSEVPDDYSGEVLHTNDHGNITLYTADKGVLAEIWSIVIT